MKRGVKNKNTLGNLLFLPNWNISLDTNLNTLTKSTYNITKCAKSNQGPYNKMADGKSYL